MVVLSLALPIMTLLKLGWTGSVHRQDKHDFSLIMIDFQLVSTHHDGNRLGSLSYLPRVRIEKRGSQKPINLTEKLFIERSRNSRKRTVFLLQLSLILKSLQ